MRGNLAEEIGKILIVKFSFKAIKQQDLQRTAAFNATLKEKLDNLKESNLKTRPLPDIPSELQHNINVSKYISQTKLFVFFFSLFRKHHPIRSLSVPGTNKNVVQQKENVFDAIKKPPSLVMEKIKNSTAATLDRMAVLQARYRQHKDTMNSDNSSDKSRRTSTASTIDSTVSAFSRTVEFFSCFVTDTKFKIHFSVSLKVLQFTPALASPTLTATCH